MQVSLDVISEMTYGAVCVEQGENGIRFHRFTQEQRELYLAVSPEDFYPKACATAGVSLCFRTNSSFVGLEYRMTKGSSRKFGWIDVYEDGVLMDHFGGDTARPLEGSAKISLHSGEKLVQIYLPWSASCEIRKLEVEDGAYLHPVKREKTMIAYGDSITQGYDALYPSLSYASLVADWLDMNCVNKAIGGETFVPELLDSQENLCPELITVAYGTNDWGRLDPVTLETRCRAFVQKLTRRYPQSRIIAILPIWRADMDRISAFGAPLPAAISLMEGIYEEFGIPVIRGMDLTPHLSAFYADAYGDVPHRLQCLGEERRRICGRQLLAERYQRQ